jgi:hypothetical protein
VSVNLDEYNEIRSDGAAFPMVDGHQDPRIETTVEGDAETAVVRKVDPEVRALVEALDPRGDDRNGEGSSGDGAPAG